MFVACASGGVRVFEASSLGLAAQLPRPHHLGVDVAQATTVQQLVSHPRNATYPDTVSHCKENRFEQDRRGDMWIKLPRGKAFIRKIVSQ